MTLDTRREKQRENAKRWRDQNRGKSRAQARAGAKRRRAFLKANDPEGYERLLQKHRDSNKRLRARHPDRIKAKAKKYYAKNKRAINDKSTAWGRLNKDRRRASKDKWMAKNPAWFTEWNVKRKYGLSPAQYEQLKQRFGNACGCCASPVHGRSLHVDHCHVTGAVRGILCRTCNVAIGMLGDNSEGVLRALRYLASATRQERDCA